MNTEQFFGQYGIFVVLAIIIIVALASGGKKNKDKAPIPDNLMDPNGWEIGPIINGDNSSMGVPVNPLPHPEGWCIDIPHPNAEAGHVHYVTVPTGPLTGKTQMILRGRLEAAADVEIVPTKFPNSPSLLTLYLQRAGDDWSARGEYETYRWWASFNRVQGLRPGFQFEIVASFDRNWTAVLTSSREKNPEAFQAALDNARRIGFCLGGGDGAGHGVYATGPARLVITHFSVE
jgi:hypothetical protein